MELTRKVFYNRRNGQGSITIPADVLKELQTKMKTNKLDTISLKILSRKEVSDFKKSQV